MVEEIMGQIIAYIPENTTTVRSRASIPVEGEDSVRKLPEWRRKNKEQSWWHHQAILVHWEIVMDSMQQEMQRKTHAVVGKESKR